MSAGMQIKAGQKGPIFLQTNAVATGNGIKFRVDGCSHIVAQITELTTATVTWEASNDDTTWVAIGAKNLGTGAVATTSTVAGLFLIETAGLQQFRARISAWTAGDVSIKATGVFLGTGSNTSIEPTSAGSLGKAEDAVHVSGDVGVMSLGVRVDTAAAQAAAGDYTALLTDANGRLHVVSGPTRLAADNLALPTAPDVLCALFGQDNAGTLDVLRAPGPGDVGTGYNTGGLLVVPVISDGVNHRIMTTASGVGDSSTGTAILYMHPALSNGTTYDHQRGNVEITVLTSAARTTTQTQADQTNYNGKGIVVVLDMTSAGTGSVTLEIQIKDPVSAKYIAILTGAAVTTNSTNTYRVYPGLTAVANLTVNDILARIWRIVITANNANSSTYSVGAIMML